MRLRALCVMCAFAACSGDGGSSGDDATGDDAATNDDGGPGDGPTGSDGMSVTCNTTTPATAGEPAALTGIVAAHNNVRCQTGATTPLPDLVWDDTLAQTAAAWIAMCEDNDPPAGLIDHNPGRGGNVGENVYGSGGGVTGPGVVQYWASEKANYNYATNTCAQGQVCGHYTQIVWRNTTKVGCAIGTCSGLTYSTSVVCNYSPAGNFNGQSPY